MAKGAALAKSDVQSLLIDWRGLNENLLALSLPAVQQLLEEEMKGKQRLAMLLRLHARFNKLRAVRERRELAEGKLPTWPK